MKLGVLLAPEVEVPETIKTLHDFEFVSIVIGQNEGSFFGRHLIIEGEQDIIEEFFVKLHKVWVQKPGTPAMAQQFELWEFKP